MRSATTFERRIQDLLPHLPARQVADLAWVIGRLTEALKPDQIFLFGSQARGTPRPDSDFDLLVVLPDSVQAGEEHVLRGYEALRPWRLPVELVVTTRSEFERRLPVVMSLPGVVAREGLLLHDARAAALA